MPNQNNEKPSNQPLRKARQREKVEYRGDYRIVGTVYVANGQKQDIHVGYVVADTKSYTTRLFTITQTQELLKRSKFENVTYDVSNGEIINLECGMSRLPKYGQNGVVTENPGVTILARIVDENDNTRGYRILDEQSKIRTVKATDLTKAVVTEGVRLINGKLVTQGSKVFISAIKNTFKRIELVNEKDNTEIKDALGGYNKTAEERKEDHKRYRKKLISKLATDVFRWGRASSAHGSDRLKKDEEILFREIITPRYPNLRYEDTDNRTDYKTLAIFLMVSEGVPMLKYNSRGQTFTKEPIKPGMYYKIVTFARKKGTSDEDPEYELRNTGRHSPFSQHILDLAKQYDKTGDVVKLLVAYNFHIQNTERSEDGTYKAHLPKEMVQQIKNPLLNRYTAVLRNEYLALKAARVAKERPKFNTANLDYSSLLGVEGLGLTLDPKRHKTRTDSPIWVNKKGIPLRYAFRHLNLPAQALQSIANNISCFGDLKLVEDISIVLKARETGIQVGNYEKSRYDTKLNFYLFVLSLNNFELADILIHYLKDRIKVAFDPDKVSRENYFLTKEDVLYYQSGLKFNRELELRIGSAYARYALDEIPTATVEAYNLMVAESHDTNQGTGVDLKVLRTTPSNNRLYKFLN